MKSKISIFALSFVTVCMMSSCLGDKDDTENVYYDDAAITSIKLTLNRYYTVKTKDGIRDSLVKKAFSGDTCNISIDQYAGTITNNPDSFPVGTDLKHVVISSISTINNSAVYLKSTQSDSIIYIPDSVDFSVPRDIIVFSSSANSKLTSPIYSPDMPGSRKYTVNLVAHKEYADSFKWSKLCVDNDIKNYTSVKTGICNKNIVVFGKTASGTELKTLVNDSFKKVKSFGANATMATDGKMIYVTDGGVIYSSSDATNWKTVSTNVKSVIGVCGKEMFAMSNANQLMMSLDNGISWTSEDIDDDAKYIPSSDINFVSTTTESNNDIKRAFVIGNSSANNTKAEVWSKIVEDNTEKDQSWMYQKFNNSNNYYLPKLSNLSVTAYDNNMLAIGGKCDKIYYSVDCGICWNENDNYVLPEGFSANTASIVADDDYFIWIVCTGSGQVWKGRINKMGWDKK